MAFKKLAVGRVGRLEDTLNKLNKQRAQFGKNINTTIKRGLKSVGTSKTAIKKTIKPVTSIAKKGLKKVGILGKAGKLTKGGKIGLAVGAVGAVAGLIARKKKKNNYV